MTDAGRADHRGLPFVQMREDFGETGEPARQRIVIAGGGFGGVYAARYLESLLPPKTGAEVILINKENYFVFQPLLPEVVSGNIGILDTVSPLRMMLKRTRVLVREIESIDLAARTISLAAGFRPRQLQLRFDHLVLALGTVTDFRGIAGLHEHALPFKNLADAIHLRNHLIHILEEASIEGDDQQQRRLLTIVVAGGGFSGVEVAAEVNDFLRNAARHYYREIRPESIRVVLVHSGERVLHRELSESLSIFATRQLQKRGIELKLGRRLRTASPDAAILDDGERIETKTLVSTVPSSPHPLLETLDLPKRHGRLAVDRFLAVDGHSHVWALGDCAMVPSGDNGQFSPATAQHATRQARTLATNLAATIRGGKLRPFSFGGLGKMGSIGHHCAVAELFDRIRIAGLPAWVLWRTVYWWKLPGVVRKLKVGVAWFLDAVFSSENVQLRLGVSNGITQAHFEPGEVIFRQGELGDAFYIILHGEVDVLLESEGIEQTINHLRAGDYFGELALLNGRARTATVRASAPTELLILRKGEFTALISNMADLRSNIEAAARSRRIAAPH